MSLLEALEPGEEVEVVLGREGGVPGLVSLALDSLVRTGVTGGEIGDQLPLTLLKQLKDLTR